MKQSKKGKKGKNGGRIMLSCRRLSLTLFHRPELAQKQAASKVSDRRMEADASSRGLQTPLTLGQKRSWDTGDTGDTSEGWQKCLEPLV